MKNKLYILTALSLSGIVLILSSCLKDNRYIDFAKVGTIVEMPYSGAAFFGQDAITAAPDSDANGTINVKFAVIVASPTPPKTATTVTLTVDTTLIAAYNAANPAVKYVGIPSNAYVLNKITVTIPAGQTVVVDSITFYKNKLSSTESYMAPLKIVSNSGNYTISSNMGIHYYHFIGNDFAGTYHHTFVRYNASDSTSTAPNSQSYSGNTNFATFSPVTPTQFEVYSGYAGTIYRYEVTFTETGSGTSAMYSNFAVSLNASDIATEASSITIVQQPKFLSPLYDPSKSYTFAQALELFQFQYIAHTSADRYLIDRYYK